MKINAIRKEGYELLHWGLVELAQVEANGIRIDIPKLQKTKENLKAKLRDLKQEMQQDEVWKVWRKKYGAKANLTSRKQLSDVLHVELEYKVTDFTETGEAAADEEALQKIDNPFIPKLIRYLKYEKALGTFLKGIEKEVAPDGRLHPFFNLHTARTYRSSSDSPNFQNFPVRDKEVSEIIRSLFISRDGSLLIENDFKGIEVCLSAAYHKDPNFISYITTPGKDMHRDMAAQIYCLKPKEVSKDARYGAKNKFVFPQFYGDFYCACAKNMWEWIEKGKLTTPDGTPLKEHLAEQGITKLGKCDPDEKAKKGTFEKHVQEIEDDFWNNRFRVYGQWRRDWYKRYLSKGYFDLLTGFRISGSFARNAVCNYPIQGSAFHCLLWSLIKVNRFLRGAGMESMVVGQIHDSLMGDVVEDELRDYFHIIEQVTTKDMPAHYDWLIVPPEIEYEICPPGKSWFQKKEMKFKDGRFLHPQDSNKSTTDVQKFLKIISKEKE